MSLHDFLARRRTRKAARDFSRHVRTILAYDDDILAPDAKAKLLALEEEARGAAALPPPEGEARLDSLWSRLRRLRPAPSFRVVREYVEIVAVALTVAFGVRALALQPFKIPTSSMQPTLYGVHYAVRDALPSLGQPLDYALFSSQRAEAAVREAGCIERLGPTWNRAGILPQTRFAIGGCEYSLPGDLPKILQYAFRGRPFPPDRHPEAWTFAKGERLCDGWLVQGDHLFVDRVSYQFSEPRRGDIVVFCTEGLVMDGSGAVGDEAQRLITGGYYYVKRLMGMPGDELKIEDGVLMVKERGSDCFAPASDLGVESIRRIYSGRGGYHGHLALGRLAAGKVMAVPEGHYAMLGDNSANSSDSRFWGFVPRRNIVGRALFVFWPLSRRWGLADSRPPLDAPTPAVRPGGDIPTMALQ